MFTYVYVFSIYKSDNKLIENIENNNVTTTTITSTTTTASTTTDSEHLFDRVKNEPLSQKRNQSVSPSDLQSKFYLL